MRVTSVGLAGAAAIILAMPGWAAEPVPVDQGPQWTNDARTAFYSQDQGSQIMPLAWMMALKQPDGSAFLEDSLGRYGYLRNPESPTPGLPVGFAVNNGIAEPMIGMTCAACHTRQIRVDGTEYRIDGGPAIVDIQSFLADLDTAVNTVLTDQVAFTAFARAVLGPSPPPAEEAQLKSDVDAWYLRYHTLMAQALPPAPWGIGRLDAFGMIFNRLTGLDLGQPPSYLIPDNIHTADAAVRYPFLWNAPKQDFTQWPGFAANGNDLLALARNLGQVYGVFATFAPRKDPASPLGVDYLGINSANFDGLGELETLVTKLGPPKWPWPIDSALAAEGKQIFNLPASESGCVECHGIRPGIPRPPNSKTWATPLLDVGTDTREYQILSWAANTGELNGAAIPDLAPTPLQPVDASLRILGVAVNGSILQYYSPLSLAAAHGTVSVPTRFDDLADAFGSTAGLTANAAPAAAYEARVLEGIWAAAPYLHNGSVPSLAELLTPPNKRVDTFEIGPVYNRTTVGLARQQGDFSFTLRTTGCDDVSSGVSHCGHDYGTALPEQETRALLEYLKTL